MEYFLLSRLSTNNFFIDVLILFLLIPFVQFISNHMKTDLPDIINKLNYNIKDEYKPYFNLFINADPIKLPSNFDEE